VKARLWGTRGSVASAGPQTARYGGNTACVEVRADDGTLLVLDAGTGIQRLGNELEADLHRIDILLTHLHMDHIQGLGFFAPIFRRGCEIHVWGPPSPTLHLRARLTRYLSPPLFPIRLRDLRANFEFHDAPQGRFPIGPFTVEADEVIHPGATLGYRVSENGRSLAYLSDHEPALAADGNRGPEWISGMGLARDADILIATLESVGSDDPARADFARLLEQEQSGSRPGAAEALAAETERLAAELARKPSVPVIITKEHVNAVSRAMGAGISDFADGDALIGVGLDPASREAALAYFQRTFKR